MINWEDYPDFSEKEFECSCGCGICNVNKQFLDMLQAAREVSRMTTELWFKNNRGIPFKVESGCRCKKHNKDEGGKDDSSHIATEEIECTAVDLKIHNDRERCIIIDSLMAAGFNRIGLYRKHNGLHTDSDPTKDKYAFWLK